MPVYKFKSLEDAENALWYNKVDSEYLKRLREFYELKSFLFKRKQPRGIYKFKTLEAAGEARAKDVK
jgi:hypothetical protein